MSCVNWTALQETRRGAEKGLRAWRELKGTDVAVVVAAGADYRSSASGPARQRRQPDGAACDGVNRPWRNVMGDCDRVRGHRIAVVTGHGEEIGAPTTRL